MTLLRLLTAVAVLSLGLRAQTAPDDAEKADIQQMKQEIADLESKLAAINQTSGADASQSTSSAGDAAAPAHGLQSVVFHGVSDLNFGRPIFSVLPPDGLPSSTNSFGLGDLDLYMSANLSDRLSFFAELLITSDFTNEFSAELDRMMLSYKFNDYLKLTAGKFRTRFIGRATSKPRPDAR